MTGRGALILIGLALLGHQRVEEWQTNVTLWTAAVSVAPQSFRARVNLKVALEQSGNWVGAITVCRDLALMTPETALDATMRARACGGFSGFSR